MKKALIALFLLLIPVGLFAADIPNVVLVSIDALHPLALTKNVSPNLWQIMQEGQYTLDGKSVTPPQTLINHGTSHPEDYRLPFLILSDVKKFPDMQGRPYSVTELRAIISGSLE